MTDQQLADRFEAAELPAYAAYYRHVRARLEQTLAANGQITTVAEPTSHCEVCRWWSTCDAQWRQEDHLSLVAGITKLQREQLEEWHVQTVEELASMPLPITERPQRGSRETYTKVREQARVQVEGRQQQRPVYEVLPFSEDHGFPCPPVNR